MRGRKNRLGSILILAVCLLGLGGCASRKSPTQDDYEKISFGMKYDEVVAVMGEPQKEKSAFSRKNSEWKVGDTTYLISFQDEMVVDMQKK